jgi:hypothetical protein
MNGSDTVGGAVYVGFGTCFAVGLAIWLALAFRYFFVATFAVFLGRELPGKVVKVLRRNERASKTVAAVRVSFRRPDGTAAECGGSTSNLGQMTPGAHITVRYWPFWRGAASASTRRGVLAGWFWWLLPAVVFAAAGTALLWDGGSKLGWW